MKNSLGRPMLLCAVALSLTVVASTANAFSPRSPQVPFQSAWLQGWFDPWFNGSGIPAPTVAKDTYRR